MVAKKESVAAQARKRNSMALKSLFNSVGDGDGNVLEGDDEGGATTSVPSFDGAGTGTGSPSSDRITKARSMIERIRAQRAKTNSQVSGSTAVPGGGSGGGPTVDSLVSSSLGALPPASATTPARAGRLTDGLARGDASAAPGSASRTMPR
jgi:hypothetical protein